MTICTVRWLGAALALGLSASASFAQDATADTVVATVNGSDITLGHMIVLRSQLPAQYQQLPADVLFDGVLEQLVRQAIFADAVTEMSREVSLRLDNDRRAVLAGEIIAEVTGTAVSDEALQAAYEEAIAGQEAPTEYNAAHILVATEEEAQALITELNGGADFGDLAREKSTGPSGPNGGDLGWFEPGMMVEPFETAVMAMEAGGISDPVQTQFGWHVIKLNETRAKAMPTLDDMREELATNLQRDAVDVKLAELTAAAEVNRPDVSGIDRALLADMSLIAD